MTNQSDAAAERSAHVERGPSRTIPGEQFLVEVQPGVFKLKALVEAESKLTAEREACARLVDCNCVNRHEVEALVSYRGTSHAIWSCRHGNQCGVILATIIRGRGKTEFG